MESAEFTREYRFADHFMPPIMCRSNCCFFCKECTDIYYDSHSGGKDSTATVILMKEHNIPIKKIVYVRMMYDEVTPATIPEMDDFIAYASDIFSMWGYKVETVYTKHTAIELANKVKKRSKHPEDNGKPYGVKAFVRGRCWLTTEKVAAIKRSISGYPWQMIGYGVDETKRVKNLGGGGKAS